LFIAGFTRYIIPTVNEICDDPYWDIGCKLQTQREIVPSPITRAGVLHPLEMSKQVLYRIFGEMTEGLTEQTEILFGSQIRLLLRKFGSIDKNRPPRRSLMRMIWPLSLMMCSSARSFSRFV
jgi:hypothetical protein